MSKNSNYEKANVKAFANVRSVPYEKGESIVICPHDDLTFHKGTGNVTDWYGVPTEDGVDISYSQFTRKRNGLNYESLDDLSSWLKMGQTLRIAEIIERKFDNSTARYFRFEPIEIPHQEAQVQA